MHKKIPSKNHDNECWLNDTQQVFADARAWFGLFDRVRLVIWISDELWLAVFPGEAGVRIT